MPEGCDARLHPERLARCLDAMRDHEVDALLLSRAANVRYAGGARRIYSAGTRPFAPCCVVTTGGDVHVLGIGDAGVPAHLPEVHRHAARWNAAEVAATVARIVGDARRIGVDGMSVAQRGVLRAALPRAVWSDGDVVMHAARRVKTSAELAVLAEADALAGSVCAMLAAEFGPRTTDTALRAAAAAAVVGAGAVLGASPAVTVDGAGMRAEIAVLVDGYAGEAAVTVPVDRAIGARAALERVRDGLRAGARCESPSGGPGADVRVHGLGLGVEPPLAGAGCSSVGDTGPLLAGMVLRVRAASGGGIAGATVVVGPAGSDPLHTGASRDATARPVSGP